MSVRVEVFGRTDVGQTREHNEDSFLVADLSTGEASLQPGVRDHVVGPRGTLFVVADGMGGAAAGEVASELATTTIFNHMMSQWRADDENTEQRFAYRLKEAVEIANGVIHGYAREHPETRGMGSTNTSCGVYDQALYLTQIGDSRAYLVRAGRITQITKDQSLMQRLVDAGELTEEEAAVSERRNIILQALGPDPHVKVDLTRQDLRRGDKLIMCSDGLSGPVKNDDMLRIVDGTDDLVAACKGLIDLANQRGGPDNITCIVARFSGEDLAAADGSEAVGHRIYPLLDTESTTDPVPVYRPEAKAADASAPTEQVPVQKPAAERATKPSEPAAEEPKKKWWPF